MIETIDAVFGIRGEIGEALIDGDMPDADVALLMLKPEELEDLPLREVRRWMKLHERVVHLERRANLTTNIGRQDITNRIINGAAQAIPGWIAVTPTVIVPAVSDTTLTGETNRKASSTVAVLSTYYQRYVTNFTTGDFNLTVRGYGLFTAAAVGDMWCETTANILKDNTLALAVDWRLQTTAS